MLRVTRGIDQIEEEMKLNLHDLECAQMQNLGLVHLVGGMDKMSDEQWLMFNNRARMIVILRGRIEAMRSR